MELYCECGAALKMYGMDATFVKALVIVFNGGHANPLFTDKGHGPCTAAEAREIRQRYEDKRRRKQKCSCLVRNQTRTTIIYRDGQIEPQCRWCGGLLEEKDIRVEGLPVSEEVKEWMKFPPFKQEN